MSVSLFEQLNKANLEITELSTFIPDIISQYKNFEHTIDLQNLHALSEKQISYVHNLANDVGKKLSDMQINMIAMSPLMNLRDLTSVEQSLVKVSVENISVKALILVLKASSEIFITPLFLHIYPPKIAMDPAEIAQKKILITEQLTNAEKLATEINAEDLRLAQGLILAKLALMHDRNGTMFYPLDREPVIEPLAVAPTLTETEVESTLAETKTNRP